jgi:hypothetical protein
MSQKFRECRRKFLISLLTVAAIAESDNRFSVCRRVAFSIAGSRSVTCIEVTKPTIEDGLHPVRKTDSACQGCAVRIEAAGFKRAYA